MRARRGSGPPTRTARGTASPRSSGATIRPTCSGAIRTSRRPREAGREKARNSSVKFRTTILKSDGTATGIRIPDEIVEALGKGKRPPVRVTINGYTYRNTVAVMSGTYMVGVSADHRSGADVRGGDEVDVDIELDEEPRTVQVPPDLAKALAKDKTAKATFDALSYSNQ